MDLALSSPHHSGSNAQISYLMFIADGCLLLFYGIKSLHIKLYFIYGSWLKSVCVQEFWVAGAVKLLTNYWRAERDLRKLDLAI